MQWFVRRYVTLLLMASILLIAGACTTRNRNAPTNENAATSGALSTAGEDAEEEAEEDSGTQESGMTEMHSTDADETPHDAPNTAMPHSGDGGDSAAHGAETEADDGSSDERVAATHNVPSAAAAVANPLPLDDASIAAGAALFAQTCVVCHGPEGKGDGAGAAGLSPKPADLAADHVQANSDGAIFYVISQGSPNTAMIAWQATYSETERWQLVNFIRSLAER